MKVLVLVALIALVASTSGDAEVRGEGECQQVSLGSCRDYVKDQCRSIKVPVTQTWKWSQPWTWAEPLKWGMRSCHEVQKQCCQQLEEVPSQCRCMAIKQTIQGDILLRFQPAQMSKAMAKAKSIPFMCKMPLMCETNMTDGYY